MQSFAYQVKSELCRVPVQRICCARAEAYGVLLYCNTFNAREIRIITENPEFAKRLPKLFHRAFSLRFDRLPREQEGREKLIFQITDPEKQERIIGQFGYEAKQTLALHINFGVLEEDCCRTSFLRGAFLSGGSVTDPEKRYHLELSGNHRQASRELGAPVAAMDFMTTKVDKAIRNGANRAMNCDIANVNKILEAATEQQSAIEALAKSGQLDRLPEKLRQTAQLRLEHPELSLSQLAELCDPPVSKSCMNHRMRKLNEEAKKLL